MDLLSPPATIPQAVRLQLVGLRKVTVTCPGIVLQQSTPGELQEEAALQPKAAEIIREMAATLDVYLVTHVTDDVGQAVVMGALEAAGIIGDQHNKIKPHRVLFCATLDGKVSIVRQLEPDLHFESHPGTVDDLRRFLPHMVHVKFGESLGFGSSGNLGRAQSLAHFFGQHPGAVNPCAYAG